MKFKKVLFIDRWSSRRNGKKVRHSMKEWIITYWVLTKENNTSRCIDFKQLLKMQALAVLYG